MVRKYFIESLRLTKTNLWVLFQGTILLVVCSIFTLFLMFPTLVIGLEGMYLKAWRGETVKTIDLFMFRKRFFPLLSATIYLGLRITLSSLLIIIIFSLILVGTSVLLPTTLLASIFLFSSLGFIVFISWKQGQYLHALNLVAEGRMREYGKLLDGRLLSENRVDSAILVFFYWITFGFVFGTSSAFSQLIGLIIFPITVGATAMSYIHDMGEGFSE